MKRTGNKKKTTRRAAPQRKRAAPDRKRVQRHEGAPPAAAPPELEEALAEPLADVSGMARIAERIAKAQRGLDEDESLQFKDPSRVVEIQGHERTQPIVEEDLAAEEPDDG